MWIYKKILLNVLMFGLTLGLGAGHGVAQDQDCCVKEKVILLQAGVSVEFDVSWVSNDGERYTKKVFKRFWARTAYA